MPNRRFRFPVVSFTAKVPLLCVSIISYPALCHVQQQSPNASQSKPPATPPAASTSVSPSNAPDLSTPEKTIAFFTASVLRGDWDSAVLCVFGAKTSKFTDLLKTESNPPLSAYKVTKAKIAPAGTSDGARVVELTHTPIFVTVNGTAGEAGPPDTQKLRKGAKGWQIVPLERALFRESMNSFIDMYSYILANPDVGLATRKGAAKGRQKEKDEALALGGHPLTELPGYRAMRSGRKPISTMTQATATCRLPLRAPTSTLISFPAN